MAADLSLDRVLSRIVEIASQSRRRPVRRARCPRRRPGTTGSARSSTTASSDGQVAEIGDLPTRARPARPDHRPTRAAAAARHRRAPGVVRLPAPPPADELVPRRAGADPRPGLRQPLPDREGAAAGTSPRRTRTIVVALAAAAGVAIENARLYEEAARREHWLSATAEITGSLPAPSDGRPTRSQLVADRAREVADADVAWVRLRRGARRWSSGVSVRRGGWRSAGLCPRDVAGRRGRDDAGRRSRRRPRQTPAGVSTWSARPRLAPLGRPSSYRCAVDVGRRGRARPGVDRPSAERVLHAIEPDMPASFAEQAALALQVARAAGRTSSGSRCSRTATGSVATCTTWSSSGCSRSGSSLQGPARQIDEPDGRDRGSSQAVDDLDATIKDIRRSIFALGALGATADIQTEVTRLVDRAAGTLKFRPTLLFEGPVRTLVDGGRGAGAARRPGRGAVERHPARRGGARSRSCWRPGSGSS